MFFGPFSRSILTSCQPQVASRLCLRCLAALATRQSRVAKLRVEGCQNLSWGCQNRGRRLPNRRPGLPFGSQGCQQPSREWQPARPALNADQAFGAVFPSFSFFGRHLKTWRERTPSSCGSRGEETVLCNYRRRVKDKFVKRMGTIAQLVAATPARF